MRRFIELASAEIVAADKEEGRKEALLPLKGFKVVGSMENPPAANGALHAFCMQLT